MEARTRFAPSPTGELHLGNVRIAVLNWLYARHRDGNFVLRIEDTDADRNVLGADDAIMEALRDLGLDWDEGPDVGGPYGPYLQSERGSIYVDRADRLLESGAAYRCYCDPELLEEKKKRALARGDNPFYDGTCRELTPEERAERSTAGAPSSVRFRVPEGDVVVHDRARGEIRFDRGEFGDFVILKSDGAPTYNFAVVVDDHAMAISHVIRGAGHLANTPRQVMLYAALGQAPPQFVHVPHVLSPDGSPLSKRKGAKSLRDYLNAGFHPEALINYLSLLSWSSESGEEVLPVERLISEIDLDRLGVSDARLDPDKIEWLSGEHVRRMDPRELAERIAPYVVDHPGLAARAERVATALQPRLDTFSQVIDFLPQFDPPSPMRWSDEARSALAGEGVRELFVQLRARLEGVDPWDGAAALAEVRAAGAAAGLKGRSLFMPVRAGLSGETSGPEMVDILELQGRESALRVIDDVLTLLDG